MPKTYQNEALLFAKNLVEGTFAEAVTLVVDTSGHIRAISSGRP